MAETGLSPEVLKAFEAAEARGEEAEGDTIQLPTPPPPCERKHAKNLLSLFDEPTEQEAAAAGKTASDGAPPARGAPACEAGAACGACAKAPPPIVVFPEATRRAAAASSSGPCRGRLALAVLCLALLFSTAAAFACSARAGRSTRALCGEPAVLLPRGARRVRRLARRYDAAVYDEGTAAALGGETSNDTQACDLRPDGGAARRLEATLLHQVPGLDPADAAAVSAALAAAGGDGGDALYRAEDDEEARGGGAEVDVDVFAQLEAAYAAASRGQVLHVRKHVLGRLDGSHIFHTSPEISLVDAVTLTEGLDYTHAYKRPQFEPLQTKEGAFVLGVRDHLVKGNQDVLHQDPAIDIADLAAVKERTRLTKLNTKLRPKFRRR